MADSDGEVEEVVVDLAEANQLFQAYLSRGKLSFLERLEKMAMDDEEMGDDDTIGPAMESLTKYILSHDGRDIMNINLFSLTEFGLSVNAMHNVGYLVILMDKANRRRSNGSKVTDDSVEHYDEDFESLENSCRSIASGTLIIDGQPTNPSAESSPEPASRGQAFPRQGSSGSSTDRAQAAAPADLRASRLESRGKDKEWIAKGHWRMGEKIGSGAFGEVFQGLNSRNGQLFAVKRMKITPGQAVELENLANEIDLMRSLTHPNIVQYIGTKVDSVNEYVYIFQEWVPGGSVASLLEKFGPFQIGVVQTYTRQILLGLQYLHDNGIIHRDIKGGNILVENSGSVKLADFGASAKMAMGETQETQTIKGTPYFMAPEVLSQSKYGRKGDVWAVGCTVIQMLTGQPPWKANNIQNIVQLHMLLTNMKEGPPKIDREVPAIVGDFLNFIFKKDPKERPSPAELLLHAFLGDDDLDDSMGTIGPGGLSLGNRPYRESEPGSGGSSSDLFRLKDSHRSPAYEKFELAGIKNNFSAEDTMVNIDNEINLRRMNQASRAATATAGSRYQGSEPDSLTDDELAYSESGEKSKCQGRPIVVERAGTKPTSSDRGAPSRERISAVLAVGARVEARFRGRMQWRPGKITLQRNRGDDSYDIEYDDGETESNVPRYLVRIPECGKNANAAMISPRQDVLSPSTNPFARPSGGGISPAAANNPFARQGGGVNNPFSSPPQKEDRQRSSTAAAPPRGGMGLGAFIPPENQVCRRDVRTADSALPEMVPKSQLTHLKSSISSGNNAPKRRSSKGSDVDGHAKVNGIPALDMKHSRSEQILAPSYKRNDGENPTYTKESPRSTESTPRRLDPITRRRGVGSGEYSSQPSVEVQNRKMPPPAEPAMAVSQVISNEYLLDENSWQCMKCNAVNKVIEGVDYCDYCSTRRGATGRRGISSQVMKFG